MHYKTIEKNVKVIKEQLALFDVSENKQTVHTEQVALSDWDFTSANTKIATHGFHSYPAMMIPQIARSLIQLYGNKGETLLDPFCGSGTALVEARLFGLNSYGIDINPLALLLSRVKGTPLDVNLLKRTSMKLCDDYLRTHKKFLNLKDQNIIPNFFNIDYWFHPKISRQLSILRAIIQKIDNVNVKEFFWVAFSQTVRDVSYTRNSEFKLFRMPEEDIASFFPNVLETFFKIVQRNIKGMAEFSENAYKNVFLKVLDEDTRIRTSIPSNEIDLIVTSPPYGDSRTTVAYGQFSRLSLQWLGLPWERVHNIDTHSLGGKKNYNYLVLSLSNTLNEIFQDIKQLDAKRAVDVVSFFNDLWQCFKEINRVCKKDAIVCFVVGNRTVKGIKVLTDKVISEFGENSGFIVKDTFTRNIPNKKMPLKNSPSNVEGKLGETITKEHIVILKKRGDIKIG